MTKCTFVLNIRTLKSAFVCNNFETFQETKNLM